MSRVRVSLGWRARMSLGADERMDGTALVQNLEDKKTWHKSSEFFQSEYATDAFIAKMKKPVVAIMHGNTVRPFCPSEVRVQL